MLPGLAPVVWTRDWNEQRTVVAVERTHTMQYSCFLVI